MTKPTVKLSERDLRYCAEIMREHARDQYTISGRQHFYAKAREYDHEADESGRTALKLKRDCPGSSHERKPQP